MHRGPLAGYAEDREARVRAVLVVATPPLYCAVQPPSTARALPVT